MLNPSYTHEPQVQLLTQLLQDIGAGHLQVPRFQRPLVWTPDQRLELLRSVAQGLPIGGILVWRTRRTDIQVISRLGPHIVPPLPPGEVRSYILDGLQRLSTLFGALAPRPANEGRHDEWDVYYKLDERDFALRLDPKSTLPPSWMPLWVALDTTSLMRFQRRLTKHRDREAWLTAADDLVKVLWQYKVPVVPLVTDDLDRATLAFQRINSHSTPMTEAHMLAALTYQEGPEPFDLRDRMQGAVRRLVPVGWDGLGEDGLLTVVKASLGLHSATVEVAAAARMLRDRRDIWDEISARLEGLADKLKRRGIAGPTVLAGAWQVGLLCEALRAGASEPDLWRYAVWGLYQSPEENGIEDARALGEGKEPAWKNHPLDPGPLPRQFRYSESRGKALALLFLLRGPHDAGMARLPMDEVAQLLVRHGEEAFSRLLTDDNLLGVDGPENRLFCRPGDADALRRRLSEQIELCTASMLDSHFISDAARVALRDGNWGNFLTIRRSDIAQAEQQWLTAEGLAIGLVTDSAVPIEGPGSAQRLALRLSSLRVQRPQLALRLSLAAVEKRSAPELLSELAAAIAASPLRPFKQKLPERVGNWALSPDGQKALLWSTFDGAKVVHLSGHRGRSLEGTKDRYEPNPPVCEFSPDGRLVAAAEHPWGDVITMGPTVGDDAETSLPSELRKNWGLSVWRVSDGKLLAREKGAHSNRAEFSSNGRELLLSSGHFAVWSQKEGLRPILDKVSGHGDQRWRAALSPDGQQLLVMHTEDRTAYLFDREEHLKYELKGHTHRIIFASWSPDGERILTCARDSTGRIWDKQGKLLHTFSQHPTALTWGDWHPDNQRVVTVAEDGSGWIWDASGRTHGSLAREDSGTRFCQWNKAGTRIMIWYYGGGRVRIFDTAGQKVCELDDDLGSIEQPRWHPDGTTVLGIGSEARLRRFSVLSEPLCALRGSGKVLDATFTPDGAGVLVIDGQEGAVLHGLDGQVRCAIDVIEPAHHQTALMSPDGSRIVTISQKEGVQIWDRAGNPTGRLQGSEYHQRDGWMACVSPQGDRILTISNDGAARLWSIDGKPLAVFGDHYWGVWWCSFSRDGRRIMTVDAHDTLRVWSTEPPYLPIPDMTDKEVANFQTSSRVRQKSGFFVGAYDQYGELLDLGTGPPIDQGGRLLALMPNAGRSPFIGRRPEFSPDGRQILLPNGQILDEAGNKLLRLGPEGQENRAVHAQFSPDGNSIATAHEDGARIWDRQGNLVRLLSGHLDSLWLVCFSPDGRLLATVAEQGRVLRIWDVATGTWQLTLPGPPDSILKIQFSPDGRLILCHAVKTVPGWGIITEGYVWLWPTERNGLVTLAKQRTESPATDAECARYLS